MRLSIDSPPGSMVQVRETASRLIAATKEETIPIFLVGHVNKGGSIAGPKVLEHAVDTVLYFEGDRRGKLPDSLGSQEPLRIQNEIGVFQMGSKGLEPVDNPSSFFLVERLQRVPGSVVTACMEGTGSLLVEVQALVGPSPFGGTPRTSIYRCRT